MSFDLGQPEGFAYCEQSDVEGEYGVDNVRIWSNRGDTNNGITNAGVIATAITDACAMIDARLANGAYELPLIPATDRGLTQVTRWARVLAGYEVYAKSGVGKDGGKTGNQWESKRQAVLMEITNVALGLLTIPAVTRFNSNLVPSVI